MKRVMTLLGTFTLFLMLSISAQAQTRLSQLPSYQLRTLTTDDFLYNVLPISRILPKDSYPSFSGFLIEALEAEFIARYGETADFRQLTYALDYLAEPILRIQDQACCVPSIDVNRWMARILTRWLLEHPTEFESGVSLGLYPFRVTPESLDFDGDGQLEWILDIEWREGDELRERYRNYLTAVPVGDSYRIYPVPVPYINSLGGQGRENNGLRDFNGDGVLDWRFTIAQPLTGSYVGTSYETYLLTWRGDHMERLYSGYARPMNVDDDAALEFVDIEDRRDNWMCGTTILRIVDWNGTAYIPIPNQVREEDDCTARYAEEAMWAGDFATAAELYTVYIDEHQSEFDEFLSCSSLEGWCDAPLGLQIYTYFLGRRILAHALLGDTVHVETLLQAISGDDRGAEYVRTGMGLTQALFDTHSTNAETLCHAAYDFYTRERQQPWYDHTFQDADPFLPGVTWEGVFDDPNSLRYFRPDPARAGCDIALFSGTPIPTFTPTLTPMPTQIYPTRTPDTRTEAQRWIDQRDYASLFMTGDYHSIIALTSEITAADQDNQEAYYWRALSFEMSGQTAEALDTYVTLYTAAPGSWWGWLAGMHLTLGI